MGHGCSNLDPGNLPDLLDQRRIFLPPGLILQVADGRLETIAAECLRPLGSRVYDFITAFSDLRRLKQFSKAQLDVRVAPGIQILQYLL